jgi:hypothetical protein
MNPTLKKWLYQLIERLIGKRNNFRELFYKKQKQILDEKILVDLEVFFYDQLKKLTDLHDEGTQVIAERFFDCTFSNGQTQEEVLKNYVEKEFQSKLNHVYEHCVLALEDKMKSLGADYV